MRLRDLAKMIDLYYRIEEVFARMECYYDIEESDVMLFKARCIDKQTNEDVVLANITITRKDMIELAKRIIELFKTVA